jgi:hypothetical protein
LPSAEPEAREVAARIVVDAPDRVVITATADAPAWLVLTDTWFPGWRARVDGVEAPVLRADYAFRAVSLPPGRHEVEFTFRPRGLTVGVVITLAAAAIIAVLLLVRRRRAVLVAVGAALCLLGAGAAEGALPECPFVLSVAPAEPRAGGNVTLTVTPRRDATGTWDIYVVWLYSERAAFLGADGAWWPRPVAFHARLAAGQTATGEWKNARPAGPVTLALLAVEPGADPLQRLQWRFRPSLAALTVVDPTAPTVSVPWATLAALSLAGLVAIALVLLVPPARGVRPSSSP